MPNLAHKQRMPYSPGRTKGSANVLTRSIREGLLAVWHRVHGVDGMVDWVERDDSHRTAFYGFLTKLLPHELAESGLAGNITVIVQRGTGSKDTEAINALGITQQDETGGLSAGPGVPQGNPSGTAAHPAHRDTAHQDETQEG